MKSEKKAPRRAHPATPSDARGSAKPVAAPGKAAALGTARQRRPKGEFARILDGLGIDDICQRIAAGQTLTEIAETFGYRVDGLIAWLEADKGRSARAREARAQSAKIWDEKAEQGILLAGDKFELEKARDLAHHYRWRASKIAPREYGDAMHLKGDPEAPLVPPAIIVPKKGIPGATAKPADRSRDPDDTAG